MNRPLLITTSKRLNLAFEVAALTGWEIISVTKQVFADQEVLFTLPRQLYQRDVIVFHTCFPNPQQKLVELFLCLDAVRRQSPNSIVLVAPYLAYLRQDREFNGPNSVGAALVGNWLEGAGIEKLVCLDPHNSTWLEERNFALVALSALPLFLAKLLLTEQKQFTLVAPDAGVARLVAACGNQFSLPIVLLNKKRDSETKSLSFSVKKGTIANRSCIIFDDLITSGATLLLATDFLYHNGAQKVGACITHNLLTKEAKTKINNSSLDFLLTTGRVSLINRYQKLKYLSVASLVADQLQLVAKYNFKDQGELQ